MLENYARNTFKLENLFLKKLILEKFGEARKFLILEKFQTQEDWKLEISASKKFMLENSKNLKLENMLMRNLKLEIVV